MGDARDANDRVLESTRSSFQSDDNSLSHFRRQEGWEELLEPADWHERALEQRRMNVTWEHQRSADLRSLITESQLSITQNCSLPVLKLPPQ